MKNLRSYVKVAFSLLLMVFLASCDNLPNQTNTPASASGVTKASVKVVTDLNGKTIEQNNIIARLTEDNKPGAIKHLYVISSYSGQVLLYSTVKGKVTSSGKRLTPITVAALDGQCVGRGHEGFAVDVNGDTHYTSEVLQDDGTYGTSMDYLYWWDSKGIYHQQYISGGMMVHISNQPIAVKNIILNLEETKQ